MKTLACPLAAAACLAAACGAPGPQPALPGFAGPDARPAARETGAGATLLTPEEAEARRAGKAILDCDTHLRAWAALLAEPRDEENARQITALNLSIGRVVVKHRAVLEQQAINGPARNRGIASAALGFAQDPSVLPFLVNNAADADPEVAAKALLGLGVLADPATPSAVLVAAATRADATPELASNVAFALFQIAISAASDPDGGRAQAGLALLAAPDPTVRAQAALSLGLLRAVVAAPRLSDLLTADAVPTVRTAAAYALGQIGTPECTAPLVRALADPDAITAGAARGALRRMHGRDLGADPAAWSRVEAR